MSERFRIIPTSHLFLVKDNKILISRRSNTGWEDGRYSVPAGHLDGNETFIQAVIREANEEIGIVLKTEDLEIVHVMHRRQPTHERVDFFILAKRWEGEPRIMEPNKCDDMRWVDINNLPKNVIPYIRQAIECFQNKKFYSEHGF